MTAAPRQQGDTDGERSDCDPHPQVRRRRVDATDHDEDAGHVLFAMAGTVTLLGAALAAFVSPWFLLLVAAVGVNQWMYVALRGCPASFVLGRLGVKPQCRW